uniref:protein-tyrosine-phosphatase n=1 Tax=Chromera velia CCMP2878 TaxID=1169474 RepID=A0A0G4FNP0_9ALVE|eukprot:Cvel_17915.t1-p1 / transcript=Cvel_17915.t1 / gene=Cvel_17915 / organism=Chromera_velia_CCMP2878 / gene_product=Dual specificity protein phosphatase 22-B, putative / transcript_product=Dual specificity protein phosphatase 22-B, putative / location=Cvel_scaffold1455:19040-28064(+) / protein_length=821 / sequence_SO=supercontig / SO=protein_coding / is_pseudo=false
MASKAKVSPVPVAESFFRDGELDAGSAATSSSAMHRIVPRIYLGSALAARDHQSLKRQNIKHVVIVHQSFEPVFPHDMRYETCRCGDIMWESILPHVATALEFIHQALSADDSGGVLVHCSKGISRSASVVVAYLMWTRKWSFRRALDFVQEKRNVHPNVSFQSQLRFLQRLMGIETGLEGGGGGGGGETKNGDGDTDAETGDLEVLERIRKEGDKLKGDKDKLKNMMEEEIVRLFADCREFISSLLGEPLKFGERKEWKRLGVGLEALNAYGVLAGEAAQKEAETVVKAIKSLSAVYSPETAGMALADRMKGHLEKWLVAQKDALKERENVGGAVKGPTDFFDDISPSASGGLQQSTKGGTGGGEGSGKGKKGGGGGQNFTSRVEREEGRKRGREDLEEAENGGDRKRGKKEKKKGREESDACSEKEKKHKGEKKKEHDHNKAKKKQKRHSGGSDGSPSRHYDSDVSESLQGKKKEKKTKESKKGKDGRREDRETSDRHSKEERDRRRHFDEEEETHYRAADSRRGEDFGSHPKYGRSEGGGESRDRKGAYRDDSVERDGRGDRGDLSRDRYAREHHRGDWKGDRGGYRDDRMADRGDWGYSRDGRGDYREHYSRDGGDIGDRALNAVKRQIGSRDDSEQNKHPFNYKIFQDLTEIYDKGIGGFVYLSVIVDSSKRFKSLMALTTKDTALDHLIAWTAKWGAPTCVCTDNGGEFINHEYKKFCRERGITHLTGLAYTPAVQGIVKKANREIKKVMKKLLDQYKFPHSTWPALLPGMCYALNTTVHSVLEAVDGDWIFPPDQEREVKIADLCKLVEMAASA